MNSMTEEETRLMNAFRGLNAAGRYVAIDWIENVISCNEKYTNQYIAAVIRNGKPVPDIRRRKAEH